MDCNVVFTFFMCISLAVSYDDLDRSLANLGARISKQVEDSVAPLNDLGPRISKQVEDSLAPLNDLGPRIEASVQKGLEPVRALETVARMKNGVGGNTILKYQPNGKIFLIKNYKTFECKGTISQDNGECSGTLVPFTVKNQQDYCYASNKAMINNYLCLAFSGVSIMTSNRQISCQSIDGNPVLIIKSEDYNKLCQNIAVRANYKYIANNNDPRHVQIPNQNKHVRCTNDNEVGVCEFSENLQFTFRSVSYVSFS